MLPDEGSGAASRSIYSRTTDSVSLPKPEPALESELEPEPELEPDLESEPEKIPPV